MTGLHSPLGASSAHRWLECPASIRESKGMPNESSVYAREGSAAHWVASECLTNVVDAITMVGIVVPEYEDVEVTEEMCYGVQQYLDAIWDRLREYEAEGHEDAELEVEVKFDLTHIHTGMYGTCDASLYFPAWACLEVWDFKYGWISVSAERNPQTMYYALGALTGKHNRSVKRIVLTIVQPRSSSNAAAIKRWECDPIDLLDFRADLIAGAKKTEEIGAIYKPGGHCKFCSAAPKCKVLSLKIEEICMAKILPDGTVRPKDPEVMNMDELKMAWENADIVASWAKNVRSYAHRLAMEGKKMKGTKLVAGRSDRNWRSDKEAESVLTKMMRIGYIEGEIKTTPKLKSPHQIEEMMGKEKGRIKNLWIKVRGGLTLVQESDPRPEARVDADKEFGDVPLPVN